MKTTTKLLASLILASTGLVGIQNMAHADDDYRYGGWNQSNDDNRFGGMNQFQRRPDARSLLESKRFSDKIDERQDNQLDRILEGFRSGKLTQGEFFKLMDEQRAIRNQERRVLANGIMTQREFDQLNVALDQADKHIFSEKHDRDNAYRNPPPRPFGGPTQWPH